MPNPRTRHSKRRKRARRTHYKAEAPTLAHCKTTDVVHLMHRAYKHEGDLYYRGKILVAGKKAVGTEE
ncbi:MAG: 50S ribosomal protein L32 [Saprospiraceae bacterium]